MSIKIYFLITAFFFITKITIGQKTIPPILTFNPKEDLYLLFDSAYSNNSMSFVEWEDKFQYNFNYCFKDQYYDSPVCIKFQITDKSERPAFIETKNFKQLKGIKLKDHNWISAFIENDEIRRKYYVRNSFCSIIRLRFLNEFIVLADSISQSARIMRIDLCEDTFE